MNIKPISSDLGVDVDGIDLTEPIADADAAELRRLTDRHHLVRFRGQHLEPADQIRCLGVFGTVGDERQDGSLHGRMTNAHQSGTGLKALPWHSDFASTPYPYPMISLYAVEAHGTISATKFVSAARAYAALSDDLKQQIESLIVLNVAKPSGEFIRIDWESEWKRIIAGQFDGVLTRLPAVIEHPRTRQKLLYVSEMFSGGFQGVPYAEGSALLAELFDTLYDEDHVLTHSWEPGDLVLWDNLALQHSREAVPAPSDGEGIGRRTFTRVVVSDQLAFLFAYLPGLRGTLTGNFGDQLNVKRATPEPSGV